MSLPSDLADLRRRICRMDSDSAPKHLDASLQRPSEKTSSGQETGLSLGVAAIDAILPTGKRAVGVHQIAPAHPGDPTAPFAFACSLLARALRARPPGTRVLLVSERGAVRETGPSYAPGLQAMGINPGRLAFAFAPTGSAALRIVDDALRAAAVNLILLELQDEAHLVDLRITRRFNLSARTFGALAFVVTPDLTATSAALTRWQVASAPSMGRKKRLGRPAFEIELVRNRLGPTGRWRLEWDADECAFAPAPPLAASVVPQTFDRAHPARYVDELVVARSASQTDDSLRAYRQTG